MHLYHFLLLIPKCHITSTATSFQLNALSLNFYSYFNFLTRVSQLSCSASLKTLNVDKVDCELIEIHLSLYPETEIKALVKAMDHYTQRNNLLKKQKFWMHKAYT